MDKDEILQLLRERIVSVASPEITGIYFLFDGEELVYVGQSENLLVRVQSHYSAKEKVFSSWTYIRVFKGDLDSMERMLIEILRPKYNKEPDRWDKQKTRYFNHISKELARPPTHSIDALLLDMSERAIEAAYEN